jgi:hypothetical protein
MSPKIIYYYQTFVGLKDILYEGCPVTHIHVSSIHFGTNNDGSPYIHLNNNVPTDKLFDTVWKDLELASSMGIKIVLMIGGAGGAYTDLFNNYDVYYPLLCDLLNKKKIISGIDLDIEEGVEIENVKMLINNIKTDYENYTISMAPVQYALQNDNPGMGGFVYKDILESSVGKYIDYFNGQFYSSYTCDAYMDCIKNGYSREMIVMGMCGSDSMEDNCNELKKIVSSGTIGGVFIWEYNLRSEKWEQTISNMINKY